MAQVMSEADKDAEGEEAKLNWRAKFCIKMIFLLLQIKNNKETKTIQQGMMILVIKVELKDLRRLLLWILLQKVVILTKIKMRNNLLNRSLSDTFKILYWVLLQGINDVQCSIVLFSYRCCVLFQKSVELTFGKLDRENILWHML